MSGIANDKGSGSGVCPACAAPVTASWRFCPHCGAAVPAAPPQPQEREKAPWRNAFGGLAFGVIAAPIMIIVGVMLCLTGLGAILGVPLIIGGVLAPLAGPMIGLGELKGQCPWCGAAVSSIVNKPGFPCHACNRRIEIRKRKFVRGEEAPPAQPPTGKIEPAA
jgi:DNA-directed RNA polymerase subunit RPC12/RpoP